MPEREVDAAATVLDHTRNAFLWRWPIPESVQALPALSARGRADGCGQQRQRPDRRGAVAAAACARRATGRYTPVRVIVDSHVVGVAKPDPRIFDFALPYFDGIDRHEIAYVGDSVTMDVGGARAAGLHPILLDPYDDHPGADFERIRQLDRVDGQ